MFGNLGLHVIKNPAGTWSYVGSIPTALAKAIPASTSAVMGQRSFRSENGEILEWRFPVFDTREEAVAFAQSKGCEVIS
jgi:hypothetical protein